MKTHISSRNAALLTSLLLATFATPSMLAAPLNLASQPLILETTGNVKDNILFVFDDSGSMAWDYVPDWAEGYSSLNHKNAGFNALAYNPQISYKPPAFYDASGTVDTSTYPSMTSAATSSWTAVPTEKLRGVSGSINLTSPIPYYYTYTTGRHCTDATQSNCVNSSTPTGSHPVASYVRWCTDHSRSSCRDLYSSSTHKVPEWPGQGSVAIVSRSGTLNTVSVAGYGIITSTSANSVASLVSVINNCSVAITGNCAVSGFSAIENPLNTNQIVIYAPNGVQLNAAALSKTGTGTLTVNTAFNNLLTPGSHTKYEIKPAITSYTKGTKRDDCAGSSCTYDEEMTNYANWYAYYRYRAIAMKTSVSRAFTILDDRFRLGYNVINNYSGSGDGTVWTDNTPTNTGLQYLPHNTYSSSHKNRFLLKLFKQQTNKDTPLRAALSEAGRIYAKKIASGPADPVQYACQKNYTILSTDGYWNSDNTRDLAGTSLGDKDGSAPRPKRDALAQANNLSDAALYYYATDLRTPALSNCTGALGQDVCSIGTSYTNQNMVSFTMGLGIDGTLRYQTDYETATSGDFYDLGDDSASPQRPGTKNWASTAVNEGRIDDLWHAAVNGGGKYFSAKEPDAIIEGFREVLLTIASKTGAGTAVEPQSGLVSAGQNNAYVGSFSTPKWTGNLESRQIDVLSGTPSKSAIMCLETIKPESCSGTSSTQVINGATISQCTVSGNTNEIVGACTGTMSGRVNANSDTRTIYMPNPVSGNNLVTFNATNLSSAQNTALSGNLPNLSQYGGLSAAQKSNATNVTNLINYLRGWTGFDQKTANPVVDKQIYRPRDTVIGDVTESKPMYVAKPRFKYQENAYSTYASTGNRTAANPTVYFGANDGMLHAINTNDFSERWAFVPSPVIPNLWKLASANYEGGKHINLVNGTPMVSDIWDGTKWRTILVAGLNGGGRGYYALDISDPHVAPTLLWEFKYDAANNPNLGYSYGTPIITKIEGTDTWAVLLTSGYNNVGDGDGQGYLYVLNALTGSVIRTIGTGVGSASDPSGLAHITAWADNNEIDSKAMHVYGGDLKGNVWRFDITSPGTAEQLATLQSDGNPQPVTTAPMLTLAGNKRVVYVATGKLLEGPDLNDTQKQTIYALKDPYPLALDSNSKILNARADSAMRERGLYYSSTYERSIDPAIPTTPAPAGPDSVNWSSDKGWFIDLPVPKERVYQPMQIDAGTLFVISYIPTSTDCNSGGKSCLNFLQFDSGMALDGAAGLVSICFDMPMAGLTIIYTADGKRQILGSFGPGASAGSASAGVSKIEGIPGGDTGGSFTQTRATWRELVR